MEEAKRKNQRSLGDKNKENEEKENRIQTVVGQGMLKNEEASQKKLHEMEKRRDNEGEVH